MKYSKQQIYQVASAGLFLVGAVFLLVHTFADQTWSLWLGLVFAVAASCAYFLVVWENKKTVNKKLTDASYSDNDTNTNSHEKVAQKNQISKD